jgi:transcriptional regulator with XRE-family HTH domain
VLAPASPVVARWDLGRRLREKRELLGLSGAEGARLIGLSPTFLSDVETGKKNVPIAKLDQIADAYEFDNDEAAELHELRTTSGERGWWSRFSGLFQPEILRLFGYEHGAESMLTFNSTFIHGLLQTHAYAEAVVESGSPNVRLAEADRRVEARMVRQRRLKAPEPLRLTAVMSETALRQQIGDRDVLREQLWHLGRIVERYPDTVDVLIVPFTASGHPAMDGSFQLMTFPSPSLPSVAWVEMVTSVLLIEDTTQVREYGIAHSGAMDAALDKQDSLDLINEVAKDLT